MRPVGSSKSNSLNGRRRTSRNTLISVNLVSLALIMTLPLAAAQTTICLDDCSTWASNGYCQDGGPNSIGNSCPYGHDCTDCGPRTYHSPSPPPSPPPPSPPPPMPPPMPPPS